MGLRTECLGSGKRQGRTRILGSHFMMSGPTPSIITSPSLFLSLEKRRQASTPLLPNFIVASMSYHWSTSGVAGGGPSNSNRGSHIYHHATAHRSDKVGHLKKVSRQVLHTMDNNGEPAARVKGQILLLPAVFTSPRAV